METLAGKRAHEFLTRIMARRNNLHVLAPGTDQGIITNILGLPVVSGNQYIVMAARTDFAAPLRSMHDLTLVCEFLDSRGIRYRFFTKLHKIQDDEIWGVFPDQIIRMQRRQHVRVETPSGSLMPVQLGRELRHFALKDISLGGFTIVIPCADKKSWLTNQGDEIKNVNLLLPLKNQFTEIRVRSAVVIGVREDLRTGDRTFSFRFLEMDDSVRKILAIYILRCERHWIRKARGLDAD